MSQRNYKEYPNYLAQNLKNNREITSSVYNAGLKILENKEYIVSQEQDKRIALLPSVVQGEYILVFELDNKLHFAYEKTQTLKEKQPFRRAIANLMKGDNEVYGLNNLFKFRLKDSQGISLFFEMNNMGGADETLKNIITEKDINKKMDLMDNYSQSAGTCLSALATLDTLKVFFETLNTLKFMKKVPNEYYTNLSKVCGANLTSESEIFLNDLNNIYNYAKNNKYTVKNPFIVGDYHNKVWCPSLHNTLAFQAGSIGYLAQKTGEDSWNVYPYSKEYCQNNTLKNVIDKIKQHNFDITDCNLVIENGAITSSAAFIYEMAIDLFCIDREFREKHPESQLEKSKKVKI